ncbi:MAG: sodium:solute symporter [Kiritimatiellia bacterium]|jgi:SSS family solute:Na+ symporter
MNLHWIDWSIIVGLFVALTWLTLATKKYVRGVADFLAANRLAGRYLLCVSQGLGGSIGTIAGWEAAYAAGLPPAWWAMMGIPVGLLMGLTGFIVYRFRQTRALTLAQFLEMRYSRRFRFVAGLLCWISGVLNFGIFPAVTARFIIYFFGLPQIVHIGPIDLSMLAVVMALHLGFCLFIALNGGQITIMITDFAQGVLGLLIGVALTIFMVYNFSWSDIYAGLQMAPVNKSMIDPFKTSQVTDFNIWFFLIGIFGGIYNARSWQGSSGFNAAPKTPHEAKMAGILGTWRGFAISLAMMLIPLAAYAVLHLAKFSDMAAPILHDINAIQDPNVRSQMTVPLFLSHILPVGMMGLFAAVIISGSNAVDDTYIHAWGTIFVQDVVMPLRSKPLSPKVHMLLLKCSIAGVAVFGFFFGLWFPLKEYILMFFAITGAIYLGGAGAVIIGGLYWRRGTTAAAYVALISGSVLGFGGMVIQQVWSPYIVPFLLRYYQGNAWLLAHADKFPINGQLMYFYAMAVALLSYVLVSLLGPRQIFDLDRMLHRGKYAATDDVKEAAKADSMAPRNWRQRFANAIGLTPELRHGDRILFWATFGWSMGWWGIFVIGTTWHLSFGLPESSWYWYWWFKIWLGFVLAIACGIWFLWGGMRDAVQLIKDLRQIVRDDRDDGTVYTKEAAHYTPIAGHHHHREEKKDAPK